MFNVLIDRMHGIARLRNTVLLMQFIAGTLIGPNVFALEVFPDLSPQVSYEKATETGYLSSSGRFIVRHKGSETQIGFTLTNISDEYIDAPYRLVLKHFFSFRKVKLKGIDGHTQEGAPYVLVNTQLAPGESSTPILLTIKWSKKKHRSWFHRFYKRFGTLVFFKLEAQRVIKTRFSSKDDFTPNVLEVLDPKVNFNTDDFFHQTPNRLVDIAHAIHYLAVQDRIDDFDLHRLLNYLNVYANNAYLPRTNELANLNAEQAEIVNTALQEVSNMSEFRNLPPLGEIVVINYVQALSHFYYRDNLTPKLNRHIFSLAKLFKHFNGLHDFYAPPFHGKVALESIKAYAKLLNKGKTKSSVSHILKGGYATDLLMVITEFGLNANTAIPPDNHPTIGNRYNTYVLEWIMYAYSQHRLTVGDHTELASNLDHSVRVIVDKYADRGVFFEVLKTVMYRSYLGNAYPTEKNMLCNSAFAKQCLTDRSANPDIFTKNVLEVLNPQTDYNSSEFNHSAKGRILDVTAAIIHLVREDDIADPALERLINYLNAFAVYSYDLSEIEGIFAIHDAFIELNIMRDFFSRREPAGKVQTEYIFAMRNLYKLNSKLTRYISELIPSLLIIMNNFNQDITRNSDPGFNKTVFELMRSMGWMTFDAYYNDTRFDSEALQEALEPPPVLDNFQALATNKKVMLSSDNDVILIDWYLWVMSNYWWTAWNDDNYNTMNNIDDRVKEVIAVYESSSVYDLIKVLVYDSYLDNTARKDLCRTTFSEYCAETDTLSSKLFPHKMECRDVNINIIAEDLTEKELSDTCSNMAALEAKFHSTMGTSRFAPVAHDLNDNLNIVIYDDSHSFKKQYGLNLFNIRDLSDASFSVPPTESTLSSQLFNINTNNGGIYIETLPHKTETQASLYVFEASWLRPDFMIWNLDHEFIHYLDGRYIKYGQPDYYQKLSLNWWSEGIAEYISHDDDNVYALATLKFTDEENWPTLQQIFYASEDDPSILTNEWGYWVHRFMHNSHKTEILALAEILKNKNSDVNSVILAAYEEMINHWASSYQVEFNQYLREQRLIENNLSEFFNSSMSNGHSHHRD